MQKKTFSACDFWELVLADVALDKTENRLSGRVDGWESIEKQEVDVWRLDVVWIDAVDANPTKCQMKSNTSKLWSTHTLALSTIDGLLDILLRESVKKGIHIVGKVVVWGFRPASGDTSGEHHLENQRCQCVLAQPKMQANVTWGLKIVPRNVKSIRCSPIRITVMNGRGFG